MTPLESTQSDTSIWSVIIYNCNMFIIQATGDRNWLLMFPNGKEATINRALNVSTYTG